MDSYGTRGHAAGARGRGPAHQDGEPDLHRGPGAGALRRHRLRGEGGPRCRPRPRRDLARARRSRGRWRTAARPCTRASSTSASPSTGCARTSASASEEAKRNGAKLPVTQVVAGYYDEISKGGGNRFDTSSLDHPALRGDAMSIKLYYAPGACSLASHIALEEVGPALRRPQKLNLAAGDQRKPEYLKLNPRGRVPTLVVDGHVITENVGILTYFGGGYPEGRPLAEGHLAPGARGLDHGVAAPTRCTPTYGHIMRAARYADDARLAGIDQGQGARDRTTSYLREIDGLLAGAQVGDRRPLHRGRRLPAGLLPLGQPPADAGARAEELQRAHATACSRARR